MSKYWIQRLSKEQDTIYNVSVEKAERELKKIYSTLYKDVESNMTSIYQKIMHNRSFDVQSVLDGKEWSQVYIETNKYNLIREWQRYSQFKRNLGSDENFFALGLIKDKDVEGIIKALSTHRESMDGAMRNNLTDIYNKEMYLNMDEILKQANIPLQPAFPYDEYALNRVLDAVWCPDGKRWSERLWTNTEELVAKLQDSLITCIYTGQSKDQFVTQLMKDANVSYSVASRLIRTELAYVQNQGAADRYQSYGFNSYKYISEHNERTCEYCSALDGKIYKFASQETGSNFPPLHANCRCCIVPFIEEK